MQGVKESVLNSYGVPLNEAFYIERALQRRVADTEDATEGPKAFLEKRKPQYKGR